MILMKCLGRSPPLVHCFSDGKYSSVLERRRPTSSGDLNELDNMKKYAEGMKIALEILKKEKATEKHNTEHVLSMKVEKMKLESSIDELNTVWAPILYKGNMKNRNSDLSY